MELMDELENRTPLTHSERRDYKAMKAYVRGHCVVTVVIQTAPYTCVGVLYGLDLCTESIIRYGFSKAAPGDVWDADRGVEIATGRAVAAIARALMRAEVVGQTYFAGEPVSMKEAVGKRPVSGEQFDFVDDADLTRRNLL